MSIPKGDEVQAQAQNSGKPCPGDVPKEGSRDIQKTGKIISVPYDWCKSTESPIPYRIWAWQSSARNLADSVRQTDCRSHVLGSIVNECYGDDPGKGGGIHSGTYQAECTPMTASPTVRAEGRPMVRYLDKWHMNKGNTWGCLHNTEDLGRYNAPKLQTIDAKLSPIPTREEDKQALAGGTQLASATGIVGAPAAGSGGGFGEVAGQIGRGLVSGGRWVAGGIEELGLGAAAGTTALAGGFLVLMTTSTADDDVRVTGTGDCTKAQHRALQNRVNQLCKGMKVRCVPGDSRAVIAAKIGQSILCIAARTRINNTCYRGGDKEHNDQITDRYRTIANCWAVRSKTP